MVIYEKHFVSTSPLSPFIGGGPCDLDTVIGQQWLIKKTKKKQIRHWGNYFFKMTSFTLLVKKIEDNSHEPEARSQ